MPRRERIAIEIGNICMDWGVLEHTISEFIAELARLDEQPLGNLICGNMEFRSKIQTLKGLAFIRSPDDNWRRITLGILDLIDNDLPNERNLVVHGLWQLPQKPPNRQPKQRRQNYSSHSLFRLALETEQLKPYTMKLLRDLRDRIV